MFTALVISITLNVILLSVYLLTRYISKLHREKWVLLERNDSLNKDIFSESEKLRKNLGAYTDCLRNLTVKQSEFINKYGRKIITLPQQLNDKILRYNEKLLERDDEKLTPVKRMYLKGQIRIVDEFFKISSELLKDWKRMNEEHDKEFEEYIKNKVE